MFLEMANKEESAQLHMSSDSSRVIPLREISESTNDRLRIVEFYLRDRGVLGTGLQK